jgi:hypothetical protein
MLGLSEPSLDRHVRPFMLEGSRRAVSLLCGAGVARGDETRFAVLAASRQGLDVVDHRTHVVEERSRVATPVGVEVRQRGLITEGLDETL